MLPEEVTTPERFALVVTVPALPLTLPVMVEEKVLAPLHVLASPRSVVEATTMLAEPLKEMPLMVRGVWRVVAVRALPVKAPKIPPEAVRTPGGYGRGGVRHEATCEADDG